MPNMAAGATARVVQARRTDVRTAARHGIGGGAARVAVAAINVCNWGWQREVESRGREGLAVEARARSPGSAQTRTHASSTECAPAQAPLTWFQWYPVLQLQAKSVAGGALSTHEPLTALAMALHGPPAQASRSGTI